MTARPRSLSATVALAALVALSGCSGAYVEVVSPNGSGVCGGEAVSIDITQNTGGDQVTIVYTGPRNVSLVAYQGAYSDSRFFGLLPTESFLFGYPISQDLSLGDPDVAINALDAISENWVLAGSEEIAVLTYDGPVSDFLDELTYSEGDFGENNQVDAILPVTVGVVCGGGLVSGVSEGATGDDGILEGVSLAAAQALYPNYMYAPAPTVTDQANLVNGISGTMTIPQEIRDSLPDDFNPTLLEGTAFYIGTEDPMKLPSDEVPFTLNNAELGDIWLLMIAIGLENSDATMTLAFTDDLSLTEPVEFTLTTDSGTDSPEEGYYLLNLIVAEDEGMGESYRIQNIRIASSLMNFDAENGLTFETLNEAPEREGLADTGGDPNVVIWAVLGGLVLLAAVALRPKGRKAQDGATIDPLARNE